MIEDGSEVRASEALELHALQVLFELVQRIYPRIILHRCIALDHMDVHAIAEALRRFEDVVGLIHERLHHFARARFRRVYGNGEVMDALVLPVFQRLH